MQFYIYSLDMPLNIIYNQYILYIMFNGFFIVSVSKGYDISRIFYSL